MVKKYSKDEERVAKYLSEKTGVGGGLDPIGFLIASHEVMGRYRSMALVLIKSAMKEDPENIILKKIYETLMFGK